MDEVFYSSSSQDSDDVYYFASLNAKRQKRGFNQGFRKSRGRRGFGGRAFVRRTYGQSEGTLMQIQKLPGVVHNFQHETRDTWLQVRIQRPAEAEPAGSLRERDIFVYNKNTFAPHDFILNRFKDSLHGKELFYHGTSRDSAISIIERGIDVTMSKRPVDFSCGKGFYVTEKYEKAVEWSQRKAEFDGSRAAIIVYKIDSNMRKNETHLSLNVDNDTNRKFWECVVSHFRHNETSPDIARALRDVKYIEGPVSINTSLEEEEIPTAADLGRFHQLCISNQGYAKSFGSLANILCVIFLVD